MLRSILSVITLTATLAIPAIVQAGTPGDGTWRRCPVGVERCVIGANSGGVTIPDLTCPEFDGYDRCIQPQVKEQGDDPDMDGREGVPPFSVGSGTRVRASGRGFVPPVDNPTPRRAAGGSARVKAIGDIHLWAYSTRTDSFVFDQTFTSESEAGKRARNLRDAGVSTLCQYNNDPTMALCPN